MTIPKTIGGDNMAKINVLSFEVANLIAAGEVVDRPASVLKELLENAIDAGSTKIKAEIRAGGVRLIRVTDNGCGMESADLPLAIKRHATSKISSRDDLDGITTLGFRGEALAATASVSHMTIISKTEKSPVGAMLCADGGVISEVSEVGCADGTSVLVENLFANVPARRKFLKKDSTEMLACSAVVEKAAMSRPDIAFEFVSDGAVRFSTTGDGKLINVLYSIEGADFAKKLLRTDNGDSAIHVHGYIGRSDNVRGNRNYENTFINGRYVKSKTVTAALEQAFSSYIAPGKFPVSALFININPALVDVNVHPAKLEVKFSDERKIFEAVYYAVKTALDNAEYRPQMHIGNHGQERKNLTRSFVPLPQSKGDTMTPRQSLDLLSDYARKADCAANKNPDKSAGAFSVANAGQKGDEIRFSSEVFDIGRTGEGAVGRDTNISPSFPSQSFAYRDDNVKKYDVCQSERDNNINNVNNNNCNDSNSANANNGTGNACDVKDESITENKSITEGENTAEDKISARVVPPYKYIGEMFNCYLVVELGSKVLIIDKHAAHERINFERMKRELLSDGRVATQGLMVPIVLELGGTVAADIAEKKDEFESIGYEFSIDERGRVTLLSVPDNMSPDSASDVFSEIAKRISEGTGNVSLSDKEMRERALYQIACKASVKGGRVYDEAHIIWLIEKVLTMPDIKVCPHGRPIAMEMTKSELDRRFDRLK